MAPFTRAVLTASAFLAFAIGTSDSIYASTIYFTSRSAWELAVTDVTMETYETYGWTTNRSLGSNVTLGGINYALPDSTGDIFTVPIGFVSGAPYHYGSRFLEWQNELGHPDNALTVTLPSPVTAIGFEYGQFHGTVETFLMALGSGDSTTVSSKLDDYAFFGAVSTDAFRSFSITSAPYPLIDDLSCPVSCRPIPEPSSLLPLGSGFLASGLIVFRRRRKLGLQSR